jgi:hypothetical protein
MPPSSGRFDETTRRYIPEDSDLLTRRLENLKSQTLDHISTHTNSTHTVTFYFPNKIFTNEAQGDPDDGGSTYL